jgi:glycosyltransferase involved in cell wall biosynthesis
LRLGLDLLFLIPQETGGRETYARQLLGAILELAPEQSITAFVNREAKAEMTRTYGANLTVVGLPVSARRPEQWATGELGLLPPSGRRAHVDVMHSLANFGPATGSFRRVLTVHDLQYRAVPELLTRSRRLGTAALMGLAARRSHRLITVSEFTAGEVAAHLSVAPERIDVIPNGAGAELAEAEPEAKLRQEHRLDRAVVLSVATALPHKNLDGLLEAWALISPERRPLLVLAGAGTDSTRLGERARALAVAADIRLLGYQPPQVLEGLYRLARCVVVPSLYEGFGFPVLEAMRRGVAVACSDIPALREVAGDAALRFPPLRAADVAGAIERLLTDDELVRRLGEAGSERAKRFSWARTAEATLGSYDRALSGAGPRRRFRASP